MTITNRDEQGAFIEIPDDENDFVTLLKKNGRFVYVVRGDAIDKLSEYEKKDKKSAYGEDDVQMEGQMNIQDFIGVSYK